MTIDDIHYLKQHNEPTHHVVMIDSNKRDYNTYPNGNMYRYTFQKPFNNVVGIKLLDAAIPRTMYVVDHNNNKVVIRYGAGVYDTDNKLNASSQTFTCELEPGDYSLTEMIEEINDKLNPVHIRVSGQSTRVEMSSKLEFESNVHPFVLDMVSSTSRDVLGFNVPTHGFSYDASYVAVKQDRDNQGSSLVDSTTKNYTIPTLDTTVHVPNPSRWLYGSVSTTGTPDSIYLPRYDFDPDDLQHMKLFEFSNGSKVAFRINTQELDTSNARELSYVDIVLKRTTGVSSATYKIFQARYADSDDVEQEDLPSRFLFEGTSHPTPAEHTLTVSTPAYDETPAWLASLPDSTDAMQVVRLTVSNGTALLRHDADYWIHIESPDGMEMGVYLVDSIEYETTNRNGIQYVSLYHDVLEPADSGNGWRVLHVNETGGIQRVELTMDNRELSEDVVPKITTPMSIGITNAKHLVTSPGIVSLIGPRYITLRCPEIEMHTSSTFAHTNASYGIATFNLGVVGYSQQRFEFNSIQFKDFHPIRQFHSMELRFELPDGSLYDFKGVDHHMLISIKTLEPTRPVFDMEPQLNPHYTPNMLEYMTRPTIDDTKAPPPPPPHAEHVPKIFDSDADSASESDGDSASDSETGSGSDLE